MTNAEVLVFRILQFGTASSTSLPLMARAQPVTGVIETRIQRRQISSAWSEVYSTRRCRWGAWTIAYGHEAGSANAPERYLIRVAGERRKPISSLLSCLPPIMAG